MPAFSKSSQPLGQPIAAAARATDDFGKARVFRGQSEIRLGVELSQLKSGVSFRAVGVTVPVRNYTIENVVLDADTLLLLREGLVIRETDYFVPEEKRARLKLDQATLVRLEAGEDIIIGYNNAHRGYQHWLTQCLPAIDWSLRQQRSRGVRLLLPELESWQEDFIRILGYGGVPRLTPAAGVQYLLPHAEYSEFLNGSTSFGVCLCTRDTARHVLDALPPFPPPHKVLYVPCGNPHYGSIDNEAEVIDLLERRGVYVVDQRRLSTTDRINLFRHADVVMGPLGEGLADVVFCKPGALLWEWMPAHHQNASLNRLAQAAEVDYWGDLFESLTSPEYPGRWHVDLAVISGRLSELPSRVSPRAVGINARSEPASDAASPEITVSDAARKPALDKLMLAFESLGDNCEFGLVQRHGGAEPLGLLRFAGIFLPIEIRLEKLAAALVRKFEGLGAPETVTVYLAGKAGRREFLVREFAYDLMYHTFVLEGEVGLEDMREREIKRLKFLRRKLLEDLEVGEKIWVWKSTATSDVDQVQPLLNALRSLGPNVLLWIVEGDEKHRPGSIERLDRDFIKGYIEHFAPYDDATNIRPASWFEVCQRTYNLCHPAPISGSQPRHAQFPIPAKNAVEVPADPGLGAAAMPNPVSPANSSSAAPPSTQETAFHRPRWPSRLADLDLVQSGGYARAIRVMSFLNAALESSVYIVPREPGLTQEELHEAAKSAGLQESEVGDALLWMEMRSVGRGSKLLPSRAVTNLWGVFALPHYPERRNFAACDFVCAQMNDCIRGTEMRDPSMGRNVLVECAANEGLPLHDVEVAITIMVLSGRLSEQDGQLSVPVGREYNSLPSQERNLLTLCSSPMIDVSRRQAYPIIQKIVQRRDGSC